MGINEAADSQNPTEKLASIPQSAHLELDISTKGWGGAALLYNTMMS